MTPDLEAAYRATTYFADTPHGRLAIRIDQPCQPLDALLRDHAADTWCYISAFNPMSCQLEDDENARRHVELLAAVEAFPHFPGEGIGDTGGWPPEQSLLVLGIDEPAALALGRRFEQVAIVTGHRGEPARLVECT